MHYKWTHSQMQEGSRPLTSSLKHLDQTFNYELAVQVWGSAEGGSFMTDLREPGVKSL